MANDNLQKILKALNPLACGETQQLFVKFWENELGPEQEELVREHVLVCDDCFNVFADTVAESGNSGELPLSGLPAESEPALMTNGPAIEEEDTSAQLWLNEKCYELKTVEAYPGWLEVARLSFVDLSHRRKEDSQKPGSVVARIDKGGKAIAFFLSDLRDIRPQQQYQMAAARLSAKSIPKPEAERSTVLLPELRCEPEGLAVELCIQNYVVFLRVTSLNRENL